MKIKPSHYAFLKSKIAKYDTSYVETLRHHIAVEGRSKDIEKRVRWDLAHISGLTPFLCDHIYPYASDEHIDTALRQIMRELYGVGP